MWKLGVKRSNGRPQRQEGGQEIRRYVKEGLLNLADGGEDATSTFEIELQMEVSGNRQYCGSDDVIQIEASTSNKNLSLSIKTFGKLRSCLDLTNSNKHERLILIAQGLGATEIISESLLDLSSSVAGYQAGTIISWSM